MSIENPKKEFNDINDSFFYKKELDKKEKQIITLKNKINNLILNKNSLLSQIDKSYQKNIPSLKNISPQNNSSKNKLSASLQALKNHNSIFKKQLNLSEKIGDKYSNTFQYKLLSAQKEIENLTIMNASKDKIIMNIQKFINNINNVVCNGKINLNLNNIDIPTFIKNLKKLEYKIMKKLNKIPKPYKIPEAIIKKVKENSIRKQKTEILLGKQKQLFIIPFSQKNKINTQTTINESKYSNNSFKNQNYICPNYSNKKIKDFKKIKSSIGRNKSIQKNINLKENTIKLKRYFLSKNDDIYTKKYIKSSDNKYYKEYLKTINYEISFSRILNDNGNSNGLVNKKFIDK